MKLLFDENLSSKLARLVRAAFPGSDQVRQAGLKGHTDEEIWEYAKRHGFTIISKDKDFYQRALLYGACQNSSGCGWATAPATNCWR